MIEFDKTSEEKAKLSHQKLSLFSSSTWSRSKPNHWMLFIDFILNICMRHIQLIYKLFMKFYALLVYFVHETIAMKYFAASIWFVHSQVVSFWKMAIILFGIFTRSNQPATNNRPFALFIYTIYYFWMSISCWSCTIYRRLVPLYSGFGESQNTPLPLVWVKNEARHVFLSAKMM